MRGLPVIRLPGSEFRTYAAILLVALGLAVLVPVFHHHEAGRVHDNCLLCVYIAHHSDIVLQGDQPVFLSYCKLFVSLESSLTLPRSFHIQSLIRAPPA
jgi:hypothetical protein